jgi:hypothetical protein
MKDKLDLHIHPLTITSDRYGGCYSGGRYTAWNLDPYMVPEDIDGGDIECAEFWNKNKIIVGKGATVKKAVKDLVKKLNKKNPPKPPKKVIKLKD